MHVGRPVCLSYHCIVLFSWVTQSITKNNKMWGNTLSYHDDDKNDTMMRLMYHSA